MIIQYVSLINQGVAAVSAAARTSMPSTCCGLESGRGREFYLECLSAIFSFATSLSDKAGLFLSYGERHCRKDNQ